MSDQNPSETSGTRLKDVKSFGLEKMWKGEERSCEDDSCLSSETVVLIFGTMRQISVSSKNEIIRFEAMSIIILILMSNEPNTAKDRYDMIPLLESTVLLLKKEAGLRVNKQAVQLLFLILNSPMIMTMFCGKCRGGTVKTEVDDDEIDAMQTARSSILEGLSECLSLDGTGTMELKLRKQVIILLAYIAASGKSGFEVLLNPVGHNGVNILQLVIRVLASEVDAEIMEFTKSQRICKERTSLLREGLIMLNRLASHSVYSRITLDCLTSSSSVAISTVDVANKIPHKSRGCWKHDASKRMPMEAELVDLAELFRARVLAFLAERHAT